MSRRSAPLTPLQPIHLQGSLHETLWGGHKLARLYGKAESEGAAIGESWETALDTVARNAPYTGQTLAELVEALGEALLGARAIAVFGPRFPLLAKFIDAGQQLSVQVHPDDRYAAEREGGKLGKTETWYILHAEPGARVVYGLRREASREQVRAAIEATRLEELLHSFEVRPGDVIFVPAGTVHAICGGIVLYELQEYSDITYRLYDYGRLQPDGSPRALHVDPALEVMRYSPPVVERAAPVTLEETREHSRRVLSACRYFVLEELRLRGTATLPPTPGSVQIVSALEGACELAWPGGTFRLGLGETVVIPAGLQVSPSGKALLVRSYVPDTDDASLAAWRAAQPAGYEDV